MSDIVNFKIHMSSLGSCYTENLVEQAAPLLETTGSRIRALRERRRLTLEKLAELTSISRGFLSEVENNKRNPSAEYLLRIANALGASVDFLLRGATETTPVRMPTVIPPELAMVGDELDLSYAEVVRLLDAHNAVVARRSDVAARLLTVDEWRQLHDTLKKLYK